MSIKWVIPSNHLVLCHPLLFSPSIFPSIRVFSNELTLHIRWPKYWSFSFSISPSSEYSGLISLRKSDLLAVQGTLKSLLQHHSSKASILQCSAFLSVIYMYKKTGKIYICMKEDWRYIYIYTHIYIYIILSKYIHSYPNIVVCWGLGSHMDVSR